MRGRPDRPGASRTRSARREHQPAKRAVARARMRSRPGLRDPSGRMGTARDGLPRAGAWAGEARGAGGRYPRRTMTRRVTVARTTNGRRVRWDDSQREQLMAGGEGRFLHGDKAMLAQIWIAKGTTVPRHVHPAEQLSYIVEGALRLRLGEDLSEVHDVRAGEVLIIPSNGPHEATALEATYDLDVFR